MSGHSKWNNIKRKKEKTDGARAKVFTKIGREIAVAVKEGGGNPASNSKLAALIAKAKANSVPNDNIQRIIKRAEGGDKTEYEAITYEGYGPGGIAVMVETLTDNRNRTAANMRHYFDKFGGNLGQIGCVGFMFTQKGVIVVDLEDKDPDQLMMDALDAGADDFDAGEDAAEVAPAPRTSPPCARPWKRRATRSFPPTSPGAFHHHHADRPRSAGADGQAAGRPGRR